jgi:hypothetical protein
MKYLKTKNISKFSIKDDTYIQNTYGRITIDSTNSMRLPKGTTSQRPNVPSPASLLSGAIRYNTTTNSLEAYIGEPGFESWEIVKAPSASVIVRDTFGPGDATETVFGALNPVYQLSYTSNPNNIIVLVENVWQIWQTNFSIVQDPLGKAAGFYIEFSEPVPIDKYVTVYYGFTN